MRSLQQNFKERTLARASSDERHAIYGNGYWVRLTGAIAEDFDFTRELLGEERFKALIEGYAAATPSRSWTLSQAGALLPDFVAKSPDWNSVPHLHAVCAWDQLRTEAFLASTSGSSTSENPFRVNPTAKTLSLSTEEARFLADRFEIEPLIEEESDRIDLVVWKNDLPEYDYELEERLLFGRTAAAWDAVLRHADPEVLGLELERLSFDESSAQNLFFNLSSSGLLLFTSKN